MPSHEGKHAEAREVLEDDVAAFPESRLPYRGLARPLSNFIDEEAALSYARAADERTRRGELGIMRLLDALGSTRVGTWVIGNLMSPIQRRVILTTGGRVTLTTRPVLLLTMKGRRSGRPRTIPLIFVRDNDNLIVCNVRPPSERRNPWPGNVRADRHVTVQIGGRSEPRVAREALPEEIERLWPRLVALWPAYGRFFEQTHERWIFVLEVPKQPLDVSPGSQA
jgi:deazaflavin-dependent oxidoreductase (nitroreductase family)